jgi:regulation of enolase protein 1 (concanavalin A-like superfamily)
VDEGPIPATYFLPFGMKSAPGPMCVALDAPSLVGNNFALTANNATDLLGNTANRSFVGTILTTEDRDLGVSGNPAYAGSTLTFNGNDFEMQAGGSDFFWNSYDAGHFADETRYGDFDVQVQVNGMNTADSCTQAGLMWRESTAADSRRIYVCVNNPGQCNGYSALIRSNPGANGVEWPSYSRPGVPSFVMGYVWIRLQRQGNVFTAYNSSDGVNWNQYAQVTANFATVGIVGPATSARNNNGVATVWYQNYGDRLPSIVSQPQSQSVVSGSTVSFGVGVRGLPALAYQWYFNGVLLDGGTSSLLTLNSVDITNVGDYRCVITNDYGAATSLVATLVVDGVGTGGFEADVMPEPNGDNAATISDRVKVGRLAAGLDTVLNSSEFQRVDCAPRMVGTNLTLGDGRLTVADWTQTGRYAAGLDPLTPAGGPTQPLPGSLVKPLDVNPESLGRNLTVSSLTAWQGAQIEVPVLLSGAQGNENGLGFSLAFDPARLAFLGVTLGNDVAGATLMPNAIHARDGRLGLALALPVGQSLSSGLLEMAKVRFAVIGATGSTGLRLTDAPVVCELVDTAADTLSMVLTSGVVQVVAQPGFTSIQLLPGGGLQFILTGQQGQACRLQSSTNLLDWVTLSTNVLGNAPLPLVDASAPTGKCRFYRLLPTQ